MRNWTLIITSLLCCAEIVAKPHGMQVKHGSAKVTKDSQGRLEVQTGQNTVLHWQDFSIDKSETAVFVQPSSSSAVLNRVISGNPSAILGRLESNGKVYLINPNGILVGKDAYINVSSFIASTLDILDTDFLKGEKFLFSGDSKQSIIHQGTIRAFEGDVFIVSRHFKNEGKIEVPKGVMEAGAGSQVLLQLKEGNKHIFVRPSKQDVKKEGIGIENAGEILANQIGFEADGSLYSLAIKDVKRLDAVGFKEEGGRIYLSAEKGKIQASGEYYAKGKEGSAGEMIMKADSLELPRKSILDVSSSEGPGGRVELEGASSLSVFSAIKAGGVEPGEIAMHTKGSLDVKMANLDTKSHSQEPGDVKFFVSSAKISSEKGEQTSLAPVFLQKTLAGSNVSIFAEKQIVVAEGIEWDSSKTLKSPTEVLLYANEKIKIGSVESSKPAYLISSHPQASGKTVLSLQSPSVEVGDLERSKLSSLQAKTGDIYMVTSSLKAQGGKGDVQGKSDASAKIFCHEGNLFVDPISDTLAVELQGGTGTISLAEMVVNKGRIAIDEQERSVAGGLKVLGGSGENSGARIATEHGGDIDIFLSPDADFLVQGGTSSGSASAQIVAAFHDGEGAVRLKGGSYTLQAGSGSGDVKARISGETASKEKAVHLTMNGDLRVQSSESQAKDSRAMIQSFGGDFQLETSSDGKMHIYVHSGEGDTSSAFIETQKGGNFLINEEGNATEGSVNIRAGKGKDSFARISANEGGDLHFAMPLSAPYTIKGGESHHNSSAYLATTKGNVFLQGKDLILQGGSAEGNSEVKVVTESGGMKLHFAKSLALQTGESKNSSAIIRSEGPMDVRAGSILMEGKGEEISLLQGSGQVEVFAENTIVFTSEGSAQAGIQNVLGKTSGRGTLHIEAGKDIIMEKGDNVVQNLGGKIEMISGENTKILTSGATIKSGQAITFLVDKQSYETGVYKGGLTIDKAAAIEGPVGQVSLFTSSNMLNSLPGYIMTAKQRYSSGYRPDATSTSNYTVYYREAPGYGSESYSLLHLVSVLNCQLFYNLYNQYDDIYHGNNEFTVAEEFFSPEKDRFGLKRHQRFEYTYGLPGDK